MQKKHLIAATVAAVTACTATTAFAATNPFTDVPAGHWAYDAVAQLAQDGVIDGYGNGTFNGDQKLTRYEMAKMVAKAMAKSNVSSTDKGLVDKLSAEFGDELNNLGVRVAKLERNADTVKWSGNFQQKYEKKYQAYDDNKLRKHGGSPWYEKEFDLNMTAAVPGTDWKVNGSIITKWGSDGSGGSKGDGFNDERDLPDTWNGGISRSNENRIDKIWVEGNLGKTGQYAKFGLFQPWTMNGFISDANIKGGSLEHWGKNFATHIFGGRMDVKDWDMGVNGEIDWNDVKYNDWHLNSDGSKNGYQYDKVYGVSSYNHYSDFVRYNKGATVTQHPTVKKEWDADWNNTTYQSNGTNGADNPYDYSIWNFTPQRKDIYGAVIDYTFTKKLNASLGYYGFRSAAYNHDWLRIGAGLVNYKLVRNLNLELMYAHGNQGGHNDAWNIELQFRGNPWIPTDRKHLFGAYLGYRYLGPDALIKSNFGDGCDEGQKGVEVGMFYNIMKNCQYTLKYFNGNSITMHNEKRSKVFTSIGWFF